MAFQFYFFTFPVPLFFTIKLSNLKYIKLTIAIDSAISLPFQFHFSFNSQTIFIIHLGQSSIFQFLFVMVLFLFFVFIFRFHFKFQVNDSDKMTAKLSLPQGMQNIVFSSHKLFTVHLISELFVIPSEENDENLCATLIWILTQNIIKNISQGN